MSHLAKLRKRNKNRAYQHKWYLANREKQYARNTPQIKKNRERNRKLALEYLSSGCCDCGEKDIIVLEFDHVRGEKVEVLSILISAPCGIQKLTEELKKCDVVCANCHRRRTAQRNGKWWKTIYLSENK